MGRCAGKAKILGHLESASNDVVTIRMRKKNQTTTSLLYLDVVFVWHFSCPWKLSGELKVAGCLAPGVSAANSNIEALELGFKKVNIIWDLNPDANNKFPHNSGRSWKQNQNGF